MALVAVRLAWSCLTNSDRFRIWAAMGVMTGVGVGGVSSMSSGLGGGGLCWPVVAWRGRPTVMVGPVMGRAWGPQERPGTGTWRV